MARTIEKIKLPVMLVSPMKELKRITTKSKKPEDHFQRYPATRSPMLKERFKLNVNRLVRDILWCEENNEFYEAEKKEACFYYNYDCPYKMLCLYGDDERTDAQLVKDEIINHLKSLVSLYEKKVEVAKINLATF